MTEISVRRLDNERYAAHVVEGTLATDHTVRLSEDVIDTLEIPDLDEAALVHETMAFLLEREKSTELYQEFDLDLVKQRFPEYLNEIRTRLAA